MGSTGPRGNTGPVGKLMTEGVLSFNDSPTALTFNGLHNDAVYYNASSIVNNLTP